MGKRGLFFIFSWGLLTPIVLMADAKSKPQAPSQTNFQAEHLYDLISKRDWENALLEAKKKETDPFNSLIITKALFELKKYKELIERPKLSDHLFGDYDLYLRNLSGYELKNYSEIETSLIPEGLPFRLRQSLALLKARAYRQDNKLVEAKKAYRDFLDDYPGSPYQSDIFLELANIEWSLENKYEALNLYEKIYTYHPLNDSNNIAKERLQEAGRFQELDTDVHLTRIQNLKSAALFAEAIKELEQLKHQAKDDELESIRLAIARLEFARKHYSKAEQMAEAELKKPSEAESDLQDDWRSLYAFSLTRQGKFDEAQIEYSKLLDSKISDSEKEKILLRLGLMSLDDRKFSEAAAYFSKLRKQFKNGRFQESAHWFEAWSLYQNEEQKRQADASQKPDIEALKTALKLLEELPKLPEGTNLEAQSIFWRSKIYAFLGDVANATKMSQLLNQKWKASFHYVLNRPDSFGFLQYDDIYTNPKIVRLPPMQFRVPDPAFQQTSWKRVEAFAQANLNTWAEYELNRFLSSTGKKNDGLRRAVANRLIQLQDWSDLIQYAQNQFDFSLKNLEPDNLTAYFFYPQSFHEYVLQYAKEYQLSPFLIWGIMREESRFQADVVSNAGAVGLLQLMPNLGNRIGRKLGDSSVHRAELTQPERNIRYGIFHIKELIDQISGWEVPSNFVIPLAVASYNAGTGPVSSWLKENPTTDLAEFVEMIPYSETRGYVKRVLQSAQIYHLLYAGRVKHIAKKEGDSKL